MLRVSGAIRLRGEPRADIHGGMQLAADCRASTADRLGSSEQNPSRIPLNLTRVTASYLMGRMVIIERIQRGDARRITSMRTAFRLDTEGMRDRDPIR